MSAQKFIIDLEKIHEEFHHEENYRVYNKIVNMVNDTPQFTCIKEARNAANGLTEKINNLTKAFKVILNVRKHYPYEVIHEAEMREARRLINKEYINVPSWFPNTIYNHYLHMSTRKNNLQEGWVAYTPDRDYLVADRQVSMPASKYIAKFYGDSFRPEQIAKMQSRLISEFSGVNFMISQDLSVLRQAYMTEGLAAESSNYASCMAYCSDIFDLPYPEHPCDAYFADDPTQSDFAIAVLYRDEEGQRQYTARAMVLPKTKVFVRVYGSSEYMKDYLISKLEEEGYKRERSFVGAKLHLREHPTREDQVIIPYIDGECKRIMRFGEIAQVSMAHCYYVGDDTSGSQTKFSYDPDDQDFDEDASEEDEEE